MSVLVGEAGLEPARPEWTLEPEAGESTNSTTRASYLLGAVAQRRTYITTASPKCQQLFSFFQKFFLTGRLTPADGHAMFIRK